MFKHPDDETVILKEGLLPRCEHFMFKHPDDENVILKEGLLPRCEQCDMCVPLLGINEHVCAHNALS
jgi:hypothetical protein